MLAVLTDILTNLEVPEVLKFSYWQGKRESDTTQLTTFFRHLIQSSLLIRSMAHLSLKYSGFTSLCSRLTAACGLVITKVARDKKMRFATELIVREMTEAFMVEIGLGYDEKKEEYIANQNLMHRWHDCSFISRVSFLLQHLICIHKTGATGTTNSSTGATKSIKFEERLLNGMIFLIYHVQVAALLKPAMELFQLLLTAPETSIKGIKNPKDFSYYFSQ